MNAKGKIRGEGGKLARYLMTGEPGKERAELVEMRGLAEFGSDPVTAFDNLEKWAGEHTNCKKAFFHGHIRNAPDERLSDAQWMETLDRMEKRLGFTGQPRMVSFHINIETGEKHLHVAWFRGDLDNEHAIDPGLYKNKLNQLSRECERDFCLRELSSRRQPGDRARAAGRNEQEESRRLGTDSRAIRNGILDCLERADSGKAFKAALEERNLMLSTGDRANFVVIDQAGGHHALNKKLTGMTLAEIRDRFADLDRTQLPTVDQAKEMQRSAEIDRQAEQAMQAARAAAQGRRDEIRPDRSASINRHAEQAMQGAHTAAKGRTDDIRPPSREAVNQNTREPMPPPKVAPEFARETVQIRPLGKTAGEIRLAWQLTDTALQFAQEIENRGLILVHVSREEAEASHRVHAFAKAIDRQSRELREGFAVVDQRGNVTRIDQRTTGDQWEEIQKRLGGIDQAELVSVADAKEIMREANRAAWAEQQRIEREQARPATSIEVTIADALKATMTGTEFAEAIDKAGLRIARANAADLPALDALREQESFDRQSGIAHKERHFAKLEIGDFAAVTNAGDVLQLNPHKLDFAEIENRLVDVQPRMPSITEARAINEIIREQTAAQWADIRAGNAEARVASSEAIAAERESSHQAAETARDVRAFNQDIGEAVDTGTRAAKSGANNLAKVVESILGLFSFFGGGEPKLTPLQQELKGRADEERAEAREQTAAAQEKEATVDWAQFERNRQQQYDDFMNGRFSSRERQRERDDDDYGRERERDRGYER